MDVEMSGREPAEGMDNMSDNTSEIYVDND